MHLRTFILKAVIASFFWNRLYAAELTGPFPLVSSEVFSNLTQSLNEETKDPFFAKSVPTTVFLGNTGCGKSTFVSLLAGHSLKLNDSGQLVGAEQGAHSMAAGFSSVTKRTAHTLVEGLDYISDMPGFLDTEGTMEDLKHAALARNVFLKAAGVKVAFVASQAELEAARGESFKFLLKCMNMFSEEFFAESCVLIVNKVNPFLYKKGRAPKFLDDIIAYLQAAKDIKTLEKIQKLRDKERVFYIPDAEGFYEIDDFIREAKSNLIKAMCNVSYNKVEKELNMEFTLTPMGEEEMKRFYVQLFHTAQEDVFSTIRYSSDLPLERLKEKSWSEIRKKVCKRKEFELLYPLTKSLFREAKGKIVKAFEIGWDNLQLLFELKKLDNIINAHQKEIENCHLDIEAYKQDILRHKKATQESDKRWTQAVQGKRFWNEKCLALRKQLADALREAQYYRELVQASSRKALQWERNLEDYNAYYHELIRALAQKSTQQKIEIQQQLRRHEIQLSKRENTMIDKIRILYAALKDEERYFQKIFTERCEEANLEKQHLTQQSNAYVKQMERDLEKLENEIENSRFRTEQERKEREERERSLTNKLRDLEREMDRERTRERRLDDDLYHLRRSPRRYSSRRRSYGYDSSDEDERYYPL